MDMDVLGIGVYGIISEEKKIVYIGETTISFLNRWVQHLSSRKTWLSRNKVELLTSADTKFVVLRTFKVTNGNFAILGCEKHFSEKYKEEGYKVINSYNTSMPSIKGERKRTKGRERTDEENEDLKYNYMKSFNKIAHALAEKNNIDTKDVYLWCYKCITNRFNSDFKNREGFKYYEKLTLEELEYIVFVLFNKYKDYILTSYKNYFDNLTEEEKEQWFFKAKSNKAQKRITEKQYCVFKVKDKNNNKIYIGVSDLYKGYTPELLFKDVVSAKHRKKGFSLINKYIGKVGVENMEFSHSITDKENKNGVYLNMCIEAMKEGELMFPSLYKKFSGMMVDEGRGEELLTL